MPHDFNRSAQRHKKQLADQNRSPPFSKGFIFITLILAAGFIVFLLYLGKIDPQTVTGVARQATTETTTPTAPRRNPPKRNKEAFEFYTLLPESEVVAPQVSSYK